VEYSRLKENYYTQPGRLQTASQIRGVIGASTLGEQPQRFASLVAIGVKSCVIVHQMKEDTEKVVRVRPDKSSMYYWTIGHLLDYWAKHYFDPPQMASGTTSSGFSFGRIQKVRARISLLRARKPISIAGSLQQLLIVGGCFSRACRSTHLITLRLVLGVISKNPAGEGCGVSSRSQHAASFFGLKPNLQHRKRIHVQP